MLKSFSACWRSPSRHVVEIEIGAKFLHRDIELLLLEAAAVIRRVPRFDVGLSFGAQRELPDGLEVLFRRRLVDRKVLLKEVHDRLRVAGHAVGNGEGGKIGIAQQLRLFIAQADDLQDDRLIVEFAADADGAVGAEDFLAQRAVAAMGHDVGGVGLELDQVAPRLAFFGSLMGELLQRALRHPGQFADIVDIAFIGGGRLGFVIGEVGGQARQLLFDFAQAFFLDRMLGFRQQRAVAHEAFVGFFQQHDLVVVQNAAVGGVVNGLDAGEQRLVLRHGGAMADILADPAPSQRALVGGAVRVNDVVGDKGNAVEVLIGHLQRLDRVGERRRFRAAWT